MAQNCCSQPDAGLADAIAPGLADYMEARGWCEALQPLSIHCLHEASLPHL